MKTEVCPVCKGSGIYKEYFNYSINTAPDIQKTCHGCNGKGWIVVQEGGKQNES